MKIVGIIPARYKSSRFEGKPLADMFGKPMIWWVYEQCKNVNEFEELYVATDDDRIEKVCKEYDMNVIMTSKEHKTGTDRIVEVSKTVKADIYVVVMGDEPALSSEDIRMVIPVFNDNKVDTAMLVTKFKNCVDVTNPSTIKLAINKHNELIYMSRCPIPFPKGKLDYDYYKNVGVYAFTADALDFFGKTKAGKLESIEEMEMLRMLENHRLVKTVYIDTDAMSVDTPKDLDRVKKIISKRDAK